MTSTELGVREGGREGRINDEAQAIKMAARALAF
jgi:hypothetical protein